MSVSGGQGSRHPTCQAGTTLSNHSGSYMLNSLLVMLEREAFFSDIGAEKTEEFVAHVLALAWDYDGNRGEILDGIGERLGICYQCGRCRGELQHGACTSCRDR